MARSFRAHVGRMREEASEHHARFLAKGQRIRLRPSAGRALPPLGSRARRRRERLTLSVAADGPA